MHVDACKSDVNRVRLPRRKAKDVIGNYRIVRVDIDARMVGLVNIAPIVDLGTGSTEQVIRDKHVSNLVNASHRRIIADGNAIAPGVINESAIAHPDVAALSGGTNASNHPHADA
jgi:hypothetical protein